MNEPKDALSLRSPTLHATIFFSIAVFVCIVLMAFLFRVEIVVRGEGRVLPIGRVQVVQPEFAGRITAIHVDSGDAVSKGDVLIEFDATEAITELATLRVERDELFIELARIDALRAALKLDPRSDAFADESMSLLHVDAAFENHPFAKEQRSLFHAQLSDFIASQDQVEARMDVVGQSESVIHATIAQVAVSIDAQAERVQLADQLFQQGTSSRAALLDAQQAYTELLQQREVHQRELEQKKAERAALEVERHRLTTDLTRTLFDRRAEIRSRLATLAEETPAIQRRVKAAIVRAPADGVVDQLNVFTVGGVAEAGAELLRIVPVDVEVEVEGTFSTSDMGFLEVGQPANIRLTAYPSERFGFVHGRVNNIAADSAQAADGTWGYKLRVSPEASVLVAGENSFSLRPGMTATIDVITGNRRIISYFFAPIVRTLDDAMGER